MGSDERRAHERAAARLPVAIVNAAGAVVDGVIENIGEYGVFVSTADLESHLESGSRVTLRFRLPSGEDVERTGEVLRLDQEFSGGDIRRSFAVRFDEAIDV